MSAGNALYNRLGEGYAAVRRPDPRIAARIWDSLGDARTVVNVGAGAGSYEPADREVTAVEPSDVMIAQRPEGSAPIVRAVAEALPFADGSFDAAMAILTIHHWRDLAAGLGELRRVARQRVVVVMYDAEVNLRLWIIRTTSRRSSPATPGRYHPSPRSSPRSPGRPSSRSSFPATAPTACSGRSGPGPRNISTLRCGGRRRSGISC